jgi:hypothetical protein
VIALVVLALPTPWALVDRARDPAVFDPSASWPASTRALLVLAKALPTLLLHVAGLIPLVRAGFERNAIPAAPLLVERPDARYDADAPGNPGRRQGVSPEDRGGPAS